MAKRLDAAARRTWRNRYVFMTAVDTGWINDEKPTGRAVEHARRHAFQTPLDEIDAAARILDPVLGGHEPPLHGVFLKDCAPCGGE